MSKNLEKLKKEYDIFSQEYHRLIYTYILRKILTENLNNIRMNYIANESFKVIIDALTHDMILSLCKVFESIGSGKRIKKDVHSLYVLIEELNSLDNKYLKNIQDKMFSIESELRNIRTFRDKYLGHRLSKNNDFKGFSYKDDLIKSIYILRDINHFITHLYNLKVNNISINIEDLIADEEIRYTELYNKQEELVINIIKGLLSWAK